MTLQTTINQHTKRRCLQHETKKNKNQQNTQLNEKPTANGYYRQARMQEELSKSKKQPESIPKRSTTKLNQRASKRQRIQARASAIHVIDEQKQFGRKTSNSFQTLQFWGMRISSSRSRKHATVHFINATGRDPTYGSQY